MQGTTTVGRTLLNGSGVEPHFLTVPAGVTALAVLGNVLFWADGLNSSPRIGRVDFDGSHYQPDFISAAAFGLAIGPG